jgi:hypothetical protein
LSLALALLAGFVAFMRASFEAKPRDFTADPMRGRTPRRRAKTLLGARHGVVRPTPLASTAGTVGIVGFAR